MKRLEKISIFVALGNGEFYENTRHLHFYLNRTILAASLLKSINTVMLVGNAARSFTVGIVATRCCALMT